LLQLSLESLRKITTKISSLSSSVTFFWVFFDVPKLFHSGALFLILERGKKLTGVKSGVSSHLQCDNENVTQVSGVPACRSPQLTRSIWTAGIT
jgi:hypothetical protein